MCNSAHHLGLKEVTFPRLSCQKQCAHTVLGLSSGWTETSPCHLLDHNQVALPRSLLRYAGRLQSESRQQSDLYTGDAEAFSFFDMQPVVLPILASSVGFLENDATHPVGDARRLKIM